MKNIFTALSSSRMFWTLAGMLGLLHFFWMLTLPFWPFTDLPNHLAVAAIYRDYDAPDSLYRNYVLLERLFQPNTFFPWFCSLPVFANVEQGARVFYGLYILALPLSVWSLLRRLGGDGRGAVLSLLLLYHYSVTWGFVGYTASLPAFCGAWSCQLAWLRDGKSKHLLPLSLFLVLLFFLHGQTTLFALFFLGLQAAYNRRRQLSSLVPLGAAALPVLLFVTAWLTAGGGFQPGSHTGHLLQDYYLGGEFLAAWPQRLADAVTLDNRALYEGAAGYLAASFFTLVLGAFAWNRCRYSRKPWKQHRLFSVWLLLFLSLGGVLVLPREIDGHGIIYERFSVFLLLGLVLLAGTGSVRPLGKRAVAAMLLVSLLHGAAWSEYFWSFRQDSASFNASLLPAAESGLVAPLFYDNSFRGRPVYLHFANYQTLDNGGLAVNAFIDYRFGTIRRHVDEATLPRYDEWISWRWSYENLYPEVPWLLVRGEAPDRADAFFAQYRLEKEQGPWQLWRKMKNDNIKQE